MSKKDLVEILVANNEGMTKAEADRAVSAFTDGITAALKQGKTITLPGFGKFSTQQKEARDVRNPSTGGTVHVPAHTAPKFSFGKGVKDALKG